MSRHGEILSTLQSLSQKQFFFYVRAKLEEAITKELKLQNPTGFLKYIGIEFPDKYKERLNELLNMLNIDINTYPACAFQIIYAVVKEVNPNHSIFRESIPLDLVRVRHKFFLMLINEIMSITDVKRFNFFLMSQGDQKKVTDFFDTYVSKEENFKEYALENFRGVKNKKYGDLCAYILYEATMEYVRANDVENRKKIVVSAFYDIKSEDVDVHRVNREYDRILADYERATHRIKAFAIDWLRGDRIKKVCIGWLTQHVEFYAGELIQKKELNPDDIQSSQQMKILTTMLHSLDLAIWEGQFKIATILKFILQDTFPNEIKKDKLYAFKEFSYAVDEEDLTSLKNELLKRYNEMIALKKSGMFSEGERVSGGAVNDDSDEENAAPPKGGNTTQPSSPRN